MCVWVAFVQGRRRPEQLQGRCILLAGQRVRCDRGQFEGNKFEYYEEQEEELRKEKEGEVGA